MRIDVEIAQALADALNKVRTEALDFGACLSADIDKLSTSALTKFFNAKLKEDQKDAAKKNIQKVGVNNSCRTCEYRKECWGEKEEWKYPDKNNCIRFKSIYANKQKGLF